MPTGPAERRGSVVLFVVLCYATTWACFITVAARVPARTLPGTLLILLGVIAPSVVALALTYSTQGRAAAVRLFALVFEWQVPARWYLFALTYLAAIKLAAAIVHRVAIGAWPQFGGGPLLLIPFAILLSTPVQAGEEIGWRGYALPRLEARFGLARASLLLGAIWACWHLPQFFIVEADTYGQSFVVYLLQVTALSVAFGWLYAHTRGSLLPVMLFHAAINNTKDIVPSASPAAAHPFGLDASAVAWLTLALLWLCAAWFLARMPKR
jgi:membrane protease YdiL (CAAX protease family)